MKIIAFCLAILLSGCTQEKITPREYPRISTLSVTDVSASGAVFHGEVFFTSVQATDYGFVWSDSSFPTINNGKQISLGATSKAVVFEARLDQSLVPGKIYTLQAYAISSGFVVYGVSVDFKIN